jgi:hypothetical protein
VICCVFATNLRGKIVVFRQQNKDCGFFAEKSVVFYLIFSYIKPCSKTQVGNVDNPPLIKHRFVD